MCNSITIVEKNMPYYKTRCMRLLFFTIFTASFPPYAEKAIFNNYHIVFQLLVFHTRACLRLHCTQKGANPPLSFDRFHPCYL